MNTLGRIILTLMMIGTILTVFNTSYGNVSFIVDQNPLIRVQQNLAVMDQPYPSNISNDIHVYLLNIDERITEDDLEQEMSNYTYGDTFTEHGVEMDYLANFTVERLDQTYYDNFINYVNTTGIGVNATHPNCELNTTLFYEGETQVFENRTGLSINATESTRWLENNWYKPEHEFTGYVMYLMNLSAFDDTYGSHWFTHYPYDYGINDTTQYFFTGRNGLETRPTPGWGDTERFYFLDVSAFQWFGEWLDDIWGYGPQQYMMERLQDVAEGLDLDGTVNQSIVLDYLGNWIDDITYNLFLGMAFPNNPIDYQEYSFLTLMLTDLADYGQNASDLEYLMENEKLYYPFLELTPYLNYTFETRVEDLSDHHDLEVLFHDYIEEGEGVVDLAEEGGLGDTLYGMLDDIFDMDRPGIVFPTVGIITNSTTFTIGPTAIAGVSFGNWQFLCVTPLRYMRGENLDIMDRSLNQLMIHEFGHTVGLPHPHDDYGYRWGGDFHNSPMAYYSYCFNFSAFDKDRVGRYHANSWNISLVEQYNTWLVSRNLMSYVRPELTEMENMTFDIWAEANQELLNMNYAEAIYLFRNASNTLQQVMDIVGDIIVPTFYDLSYESSMSLNQQNISWDESIYVHGSFRDTSGIGNAALHYRARNSESWLSTEMYYVRYRNGVYVFAGEIEPLGSGTTLVEFYFVVTDASVNLNSITMDNNGAYYTINITEPAVTTSNGPDNLLPVSFGTGIAEIVVIAMLLPIIKKKKKRD